MYVFKAVQRDVSIQVVVKFLPAFVNFSIRQHYFPVRKGMLCWPWSAPPAGAWHTLCSPGTLCSLCELSQATQRPTAPLGSSAMVWKEREDVGIIIAWNSFSLRRKSPLGSDREWRWSSELVCSGCRNRVLQTGRVKQQTFISWTLELLAGLVSVSFLLGFRGSPSLCALTWSFVYACTSLVSMHTYVWTCSFYKNTSQIGWALMLMIPFYLSYLFKVPVSKHSHILRYWGQGLNMDMRGHGSAIISRVCRIN